MSKTHTHRFESREVVLCVECHQTEAAVEGCHHCGERPGRCWWCLRDDPRDVALRAFADSMTPEKWDHVLALLRFTIYDPESPIGRRSAEIVASLERLTHE